jgi:hypothetical protein
MLIILPWILASELVVVQIGAEDIAYRWLWRCVGQYCSTHHPQRNWISHNLRTHSFHDMGGACCAHVTCYMSINPSPTF